MQQSLCETHPLPVQDGTPTLMQARSDRHIPKMLIADDDPLVVQLVADHCAGLGFTVDTASDGIQAFLKASRGRPDVLVIDINMPELDGLSVCGHLLDADRAPQSVIVITASRDPHTRWRCEGFGGYYARKGPDFWEDL